jgi:hypothetical protein
LRTGSSWLVAVAVRGAARLAVPVVVPAERPARMDSGAVANRVRRLLQAVSMVRGPAQRTMGTTEQVGSAVPEAT